MEYPGGGGAYIVAKDNLGPLAGLIAAASLLTDYVLPDDLKQVALPALAHRLVLANQLDSTGRVREEAERVVTDILNRLPIPG